MAASATPKARRVEDYAGYLHALARSELDRQLWARSSPSDVVQEAMLRAHKNRSQFRGQSEAEYCAWLRRILANVIVNVALHHRAQKRDLRLEHSLNKSLADTSTRLEALVPDPGESPSAAALRRERVELLITALARLSDDQRQAIELRYAHSRSVNEISTIMDRTPVSVAGLLRRGLKNLRAVLDAKP